MTKRQVEINFEEAKQQSNRLEEAAQLLCEADCFHKEFGDKLNSAWQGDSASRLLSIHYTEEEYLLFHTKQLKELIIQTRRRAQALYDAEMEAIRIAEEREYQERLLLEAQMSQNGQNM